MSGQLSIFNQPPSLVPQGDLNIHDRENNSESQQILDDNKEHFSDQCLTMLKALVRGEVLTSQICDRKYDIGDGRARKRDLKGNGIAIIDSLQKGRFKEFYLMPEEIKRVKEKYNL